MTEAATEAKGRWRLARKLLLAVFVLAVTLGGIVLAELTARAIGLGDPVVYRTNTAYRYAPMPNQRVERRRGAWVTINESGYRSTESWTKPAAFKVLWLGDSVTWGGTYIDDRETFTELSCEWIENATGMEAVCGNGAVNAYGVDNMVSRLRYDRAGDNANVVVVVIGWTDLFRAQQNIGGHQWLQNKPGVWFRALWEATAYVAATSLVTLQNGRPYCDEAYGPSVARASMAGLLQELTNKQDEGKTTLLVRYPVVHEVVDTDPELVAAMPFLPWCMAEESTLFRELEAMIAASGVPYLDLSSTARARASESTEPFFYDQWGHLEVRGHQVFSEAIGAKIVELAGNTDDGGQPPSPV